MEQDYESPVRVGDLLAGKYRVDKVIGVGGMGVVVSATHEALEQKVALKFLHAELAEHPEASARFQREARAAVKIRSEHVCRVSDVGVLDTGEPYMVMEYLEGQDLGDHIVHTGPLPAHEAVDYAMQACEALAEAHAAGIVHRDLKPANLFLAGRADGTSAVKVLDFGISKLADSDISLTKTSSVMGSPQYMAPEQMQSSKRVDARTDIWALGTILYELLCGDPAFQGETVPEVAIAIVNTEPEPLSAKRPDISQDLVAIIEKCLKKNPDERYQDVAELARDLAAHGSPMSMVSAQRASRVLNTHLLGTPDSAVVSMAATQGVTGTGPHSAVRPSQPMAPVSAATGKSPSQLEVSPTVASYTDMPIGQDKKSKTGLFVGDRKSVV